MRPFLDWWRKPQTLTGLPLLIGGMAGLWSHLIPADLGTLLIGSSLPLLIHNPTALRFMQAFLTPLVAALSRTGTVKSESKPPPDT